MPDVKHFSPESALETVLRLFWRQGAAATGVQDMVTATGVSRSSLYATFGGKQELYAAALRRYLEHHSRSSFLRLARGGSGLPAVREFFDRLVDARCSGEFARWGCMVANAHSGAEQADPAIRSVLDRHHEELRAALHAALLTAKEHGQLAPGTDPQAAAAWLALLAYGVNLRSRAGADARELHGAVASALRGITAA